MGKKKSARQDLKKQLFIIAVGLILIITFIGLYMNKAPTAGKAISIAGQEWTGEIINLEQEGSITFMVLPAESVSVDFMIGQDAYSTLENGGLKKYTFMLTRLDEQAYQFVIALLNSAIATDLLYVTGPDKSLIYLFSDNPLPQLEVTAANNQVTVRNLHFIPPTRANIKLQNSTTDRGLSVTQVLPPVIRLAEGESLLGEPYINASSLIAPESVGAVLVGAGTLGVIDDQFRDTQRNFTTRSFTYTAPAAPTAVLLDVTATVLGRVTHAYYTIAVGDRVYALSEPKFPAMQFTLDAANASNSELNVLLRSTTELQPLALPCDVAEPFSTLFANKAVKKVYAYQNGATQVWTNQSPANDFTSFEPFRGYFVQLSSETAPTTITTHCAVNSTEPLSSAPPSLSMPAPAPVQLSAGWNLFAMRGIVPRALTDFTTDTSFLIFECQQNYLCSEIPRTTSLNPGKPYWVYTATPLTINYWLR